MLGVGCQRPETHFQFEGNEDALSVAKQVNWSSKGNVGVLFVQKTAKYPNIERLVYLRSLPSSKQPISAK
ncbi:hypothetical protein [Paenibacillus qinlingensis]|uniref:hypothetical protein n=1 Tax=Paenibacillus qinlingensis TaxID=1837343 RepID=UPI001563ADD9|nr:hypothetical protein [Paenibacillus qinlingensis]NQX62426.1 hypothetical protein [Paenibacillus qinlingensis]